ncbi:hypothetical protein C8R46DRAFT_1077067 [Mycena filopes]|nr:hypothetical protein C8R46DRAFT_1077067 [Mycena filopes]
MRTLDHVPRAALATLRLFLRSMADCQPEEPTLTSTSTLNHRQIMSCSRIQWRPFFFVVLRSPSWPPRNLHHWEQISDLREDGSFLHVIIAVLPNTTQSRRSVGS